ncbi:Tripartite-type tricarboxylate transporter, receptor component TctC [Variovorax sp. HW608]|uniref:Bug family tripartite tricarboxylate transporter substrate binding protein n=1 Tax=Variovorax sp. HW608 TaxID=1034889 RepID=UPI00081FBDEB|nr:tripartite tricarboxylate transporter substrate binding protein [Variovorax sp. HW608]SCK29199.1 Tripartite-type tricarboxylate transporter, receptor component TctC [Variovorax sp. HW608]
MSLVRCLRALLVWMAWGAALLAGAHAETFPARPVTIVVPYAAGGFTDQLARVIAPALSARWGQPVVVDNRNGGGTTIGTALVARAPGDGHTLLLTGFGFTANPLLMKNLPYDPKALAPVTLVADAPSVLFVANKVPAGNLKEFVAYMRRNPGKVVFASSGNGSSPHIGAEMLASMVGVPIVHAAYRGNAPALNDLMGGQVDAMFDSPSSMSFVQAGRMKVIGVASEQPIARNPQLVPLAQAGVPELAGFVCGGWFGFFLPAKTPSDLQQRIYEDLRAVLAQPELREGIQNVGGEPRQTTPAEFAAYLDAETQRWAPVIRERNIHLD